MRLLDELIAGYQEPGFQHSLALLYREHGEDEDPRELVKKRRALTMTIQASVLPKYGFEATDEGVHKSWLVYQKPPLNTDPEINKRNMVIGYLILEGPKAMAASMRRHAESCTRYGLVYKHLRNKPMVIGFEDGLHMLEELVAGYQDPDLQRGLALIYKWHGGAGYSEEDPDFLRARRALLMAVQADVLPRYGFEASQSGVHFSVLAFQRPEFDNSPEYHRINDMVMYFVKTYPMERSVEAGHAIELETEVCLRRHGAPLPACPERDPPLVSPRAPPQADRRCVLCRACVDLTAGQWSRDCGRARGEKCDLLAERGGRHPGMLGWECLTATTFYPPPAGSVPLQLLAAEPEEEAADVEEIAYGTGLAPEACFQIRPAARLLLEALEEQCSLGRVLELGAGTGVVGLSLASRGVASGAVLTDSDARCIQLLRANALLSSAPVEVPGATLALGETPPGGEFDTVIASEPLHHWLSLGGEGVAGPGELLSTAEAALSGSAAGRFFFSHQHADPQLTEWLLGEVAHRGAVVREVVADAAPDEKQPGGQARLSVYWLEFRGGWRLPGGFQHADRMGAQVPKLVWDAQKASLVQHQVSQWTQFDRHPEIFGALQRLLGESCSQGWAPRILSFGCSDGSECRTMRMYFPEAAIDGIDIDAELIAKNSAENPDPGIRYFDDVSQLPLGSYDAVLVMTVLCRFGNDMEDRLPFEMFDQTVAIVDRHIRLNGYFVLYNANYLFTEASVAHRYANLAEGDGPAAAACRFSSGFVTKFSPAGRKISADGAEFPWVFFQKRSAAGAAAVREQRGR